MIAAQAIRLIVRPTLMARLRSDPAHREGAPPSWSASRRRFLSRPRRRQRNRAGWSRARAVGGRAHQCSSAGSLGVAWLHGLKTVLQLEQASFEVDDASF